jgi:hypothetical protein
MTKTACEVELEKIHKKARQRHDRYMKNKDKVKKIPLKRDIIKQLLEENLLLRQQLEDVVNKTVIQPNIGTVPLDEANNDTIPLDEPNNGTYDTIYDDVNEDFENINPIIVGGLDTIYDDVNEEFESITPMIDTVVCKCKNDYTYEVIIDKLNMLEWNSEKVKNSMIDGLNQLYIFFERIPSCKSSFNKFKSALDVIDIPINKKRVMIKILLLTISKLNIELDDNIITEYYTMYSSFV